jgi:hypothetical protein
MPYITQHRRAALAKNPVPDSVGELNYCFTAFIRRYVKRKQLSYQTINDVMGALEGAKAEFYARVARPYEDQKIIQNGDVYD